MRLVQLRKRVARTVRRRETTGRREVVGFVLRDEESTGFRVFVGGGQKQQKGGGREEKGRRRVIKVASLV